MASVNARILKYTRSSFGKDFSMVFPNFKYNANNARSCCVTNQVNLIIRLYHKSFEDWPYLLITIIFSAIEATLLFLGIFSPFARIQEFWIFKEEFSIHSLIIALFDEQNFLLGGTILIFGVVIPLMRLCTNFVPITRLKNLNLHKLAMVDIFLVSFLLFSSQSSYFFEVSLLKGFYFLFAALVVSYVNHWTMRSMK